MARRDKAIVRKAVHKRIRRALQGTAERPRLAIYRSLNHIYAQMIDDVQGRTILSASSTEKELRGNGGNISAAARVGEALARRALEQGLTSVVFDRGGYRYHGRVKALADAARGAGLNREESQEESAGSSEG